MQTKRTMKAEITQALRGKRCWYASGGGAGSTFQLAFGKKVRRRTIIRNKCHSKEYREYEGESNLLVWCTWRLENGVKPLSSSDDTDDHIKAALSKLVGSSVNAVRIDVPAWDLTLSFSNRLKLRVFCDHVPGAPSFDGNWELWRPDEVFVIGVGSALEIETREKAVPALWPDGRGHRNHARTGPKFSEGN